MVSEERMTVINWIITKSVVNIALPAKFVGLSEGKKRSRLSIPSGVNVPSNPTHTFFSVVEALVAKVVGQLFVKK